MKPSRLALYLVGILAALTLTVALIVAVMQPPLDDLVTLILLLGLTSLGSGLIGYLSHRLGWWRRLHSLTLTLTLGYLLAAGLTLLNVWLTARLMFIEPHDLALAGLLLLFAGGISVSFGYFLSGSITQSLADLVAGAQRLSEGDYSIRVSEKGQDEVAQVARAFNAMVARLEKLNEAEKALDLARRNLVAWASHDLRTPLTSLRAMLDALADGVVTEPGTVSRYLRQSQHELAHMSHLIDDLFELAQLDAGHLEMIFETSSLSDLISDTLEGFRVRAQSKGVQLSGEVSPSVDPLWMATDKISRVLNNLVENAIRHTPEGGAVRLGAQVDNGSVLVTVADTGEGITPEDQPYIFDRFYRGEKSRTRKGQAGEGSGLGLAIAKGLVEAHGGEIWVGDDDVGGAVLCFRLPHKRSEVSQQENAPAVVDLRSFNEGL